MSEDAVEKAKEQFQDDTSRLDSVADSEDDTDEFVEAIVAALENIETGETQPTASIWDQDVAALYHALENRDDEVAELGAALHEELDRSGDVGDVDRSDVLKMAVRLGLREASGDHVRRWMDAKAEAARRL